MAKEKTSPESDTIQEEIDSFLQRADGLRATLPLAMMAAGAAREVTNNEYKSFLDAHGKKVREEGSGHVYHLPLNQAATAEGFNRELERLDAGIELLAPSLTVALVSAFDHYLSRLLRWYFTVRPEVLNSIDKTISFPDLVKFGSVEAAREFVLEKEIESTLRESHAEHFRILESRLGIPLRKDLAIWPEFIELTERRNLFVHTGGRVSHQYIKNCSEHGVNFERALSPGEQLNVAPEYFKRGIDVVSELGVKLGQVMWRKVLPDELEAADSGLIKVTYLLLRAQRYKLGKELLDFGCVTLKKHASEQNRRILLVNRAQCYKWLGDTATCKQLIGAEDWSATGLNFKLAVAVLEDDFSGAEKLMVEAAQTNYISEEDFISWPLFKEFRKSEEFKRAFEKAFGKDYTSIKRQDTEPAYAKALDRAFVAQIVKTAESADGDGVESQNLDPTSEQRLH